MADSNREKIIADLQKVKEEGQLRSQRIREIVQSSVEQAVSELKEGQKEIRSVVKDSLGATLEVLQERGGEIKDDISAAIAGAVEGVSRGKRRAIAETSSQIQQLQNQLEVEEAEVSQEIDGVLEDIEQTSQDRPEQVKEAVASAVQTAKDSEEVALMQKRYAQLKTQLSVLQANLASRYGENFEGVKPYIDEAKAWYEKAKEDPEGTNEKVAQKRRDVEQKLGEAGSAIAQKEQKVKRVLKELWHSVTELFQS
ncbi:histidine kinase [Lusitaniella coriacea]|uniref:histidine kinase n=1 Tax=Lusitaniella coriacea TaxID=1983105 RepID=UPI003CF02358